MKNTEGKPRKGIYLLPNLFTTAALFSGFYAVVVGMNGHFDNAAIAIFVAMVMDGLDGRVARLTNTQSDFGAEYDSLADMVSFNQQPKMQPRYILVVVCDTTGYIFGKTLNTKDMVEVSRAHEKILKKN